MNDESKKRLILSYNSRVDQFRQFAPNKESDNQADRMQLIAWSFMEAMENTLNILGYKLIKEPLPDNEEDQQTICGVPYITDILKLKTPKYYPSADARLADGWDHAAEYHCSECGATFWDEWRSKYREHENTCPVCFTKDSLFVRFTGKIVNTPTSKGD